MKVVALVSGGKDSCYAMMKCLQYGHEIVALANLLPADDSVDELDSYMYQTVGHQIIVCYAACMGVPLFRRRIQGSTRHQKLSYQKTPGDEVEDMFILLNEVKRQIPSVGGVSSGAIASDYQRLRVESICSRLGLVSLAYLWKQDQSLLLQEMIENEVQAITVKVAAMGLDPAKHLGKEIKSLYSYLHKLKELYGINVCGEGGEYETLTLDCPLFTDARIVLDDYRVILHSPGSIAPVGVLHPLAFHLENKAESSAVTGTDNCNGFPQNRSNLVYEVHEDCVQNSQTTSQSSAGISIPTEVPKSEFHISKTRKSNALSFCCCLQDSCESSTDVQEDMKVVLKKVESKLQGFGLGWENVLYIHLYISNMKEFATVNETYMKFITQDNCPYGVPSRSTIQLPLPQVGLGKAYIELLLSNDQSKRVLHVQSISCWAPSCIGPYSQATVYNEVLHMAGQLGLDPPTMTLCSGGSGAELEQALKNSEAVAECFLCSISTSAILFVIYCSTSVPLSERLGIQERLDTFLEKTRQLNRERGLAMLSPIFLYILVPELPKSAHVEIKPILYVADEADTTEETIQEPSYTKLHCNRAYQHANWHDSCVQKCIVNRKICAVNLSCTSEHAEKICNESLSYEEEGESQKKLTSLQLEKVSKFCIYLLDRTLAESNFSWEDIMSLRIYFPTSLHTSFEALSCLFSNAFTELAEMNQSISMDKEPIFHLVPVLGAGSSATCMDDIFTCELFAQKS